MEEEYSCESYDPLRPILVRARLYREKSSPPSGLKNSESRVEVAGGALKVVVVVAVIQESPRILAVEGNSAVAVVDRTIFLDDRRLVLMVAVELHCVFGDEESERERESERGKRKSMRLSVSLAACLHLSRPTHSR